MPIIAQFGFKGKDYGLLAIAFPQTRVLRAPFYPFVCEPMVIVISDEKDLRIYPDKEVIQITSRARTKLDTRRGFLQFLAQADIKPTPMQLEELEEWPDQDFWNEVKLAKVLGHFPTLTTVWMAGRYEIYHLFENLFRDYGATYRHYYASRRPFPIVVSALMTMMTKAKNVEKISVSPGYKRILRRNRPYYIQFSRALLQYLESKMTEWDFLSFLARCSQHIRNEPWRDWGRAWPGDRG